MPASRDASAPPTRRDRGSIRSRTIGVVRDLGCQVKPVLAVGGDVHRESSSSSAFRDVRRQVGSSSTTSSSHGHDPRALRHANHRTTPAAPPPDHTPACPAAGRRAVSRPHDADAAERHADAAVRRCSTRTTCQASRSSSRSSSNSSRIRLPRSDAVERHLLRARGRAQRA